MRKIVLIFSFVFLFGDVINQGSIQVLRSLNINDNFIFNRQLIEKYKEYSKYKKRYFLNVINNGLEIIPIIKKQIIKDKIPQELLAVAMAESYFTLNAKSDKKAIGLWQFMPQTARRFGLRIDSYVDERKDPVKSTQAAIEYLKYLHDFFGKWYLAVMAYNAGEARIVEAVVRAKVDKLCKNLGRKCYQDPTIRKYRKIIRDYQQHGRKAFDALYRLYKKLSNVNITLSDLLKYQKGLKRQYLPKETRDYILKILALSMMFNSDDFVKYSDTYILNSGITPEYKRVYVPAGTSLYKVAQFLQIPYRELRSYNLHLRYSFTPPYRYYIYIPYQKVAYFKNNFKFSKRFMYVYRVRKGDTLLKIARKFGVKVKMIEAYNRLGRYLHINQKIFIPLNYRYIKYRVKRGDSILKIARKFGIEPKKIIKINNLRTSLIRVGQVLKIPQKL
ncbi:transglycosylase SLT domain-containing protein [Caminibacter sp.]